MSLLCAFATGVATNIADANRYPSLTEFFIFLPAVTLEARKDKVLSAGEYTSGARAQRRRAPIASRDSHT